MKVWGPKGSGDALAVSYKRGAEVVELVPCAPNCAHIIQSEKNGKQYPIFATTSAADLRNGAPPKIVAHKVGGVLISIPVLLDLLS